MPLYYGHTHQEYFGGVLVKGFRGRPVSSSAIFANSTKWVRFSWPFPWKCRDGTAHGIRCKQPNVPNLKRFDIFSAGAGMIRKLCG